MYGLGNNFEQLDRGSEGVPSFPQTKEGASFCSKTERYVW